MDIYLVRHGETELNARHVHQTPITPLSVRGQEQARSVAEELRELNVDLLLSSSYRRAEETARVIGSALGLTPQTDPLFREVQRPAFLQTRSHFHPKTFWYVLGSILHLRDTSWRMADAENFTDIARRANEALTYLEDLNGKHQSVVVVSHAIFIAMMVAHIQKRETLHCCELIPALLHVSRMKNCGVAHLKYEVREGDTSPRWYIVSK